MHFGRAATLAAGLLGSSAAVAGEPSFEITQTVYSYTSANEKVTTKGGASDTTTTGGLNTMPSDLEIQVAYEQWVFSVFPTQPGTAFEFGRQISPHFEVGLALGLTNATEDGPTEKTTKGTEIIPFVTYSQVYGKSTFEVELHAGVTRADVEDVATDEASGKETTTSTKESGFETEVVLTYDYRLTDNLSYAASIGYTYGQSKETVGSSKTTTGELEIKLLQLRYGIY